MRGHDDHLAREKRYGEALVASEEALAALTEAVDIMAAIGMAAIGMAAIGMAAIGMAAIGMAASG